MTKIVSKKCNFLIHLSCIENGVTILNWLVVAILYFILILICHLKIMVILIN